MRKYNVEDFNIEYTGGGVYVVWGKLSNNAYFSLSSDMLVIYDADEYQAMEEENYDGYDWEQEHMIDSYSNSTDEYNNVLNQVYLKYTDESKDNYDLFKNVKKGFLYDEDGDIYYQGKYYYSLLEGKTKNNYTSDIIFIYKEPIFKKDGGIINGEVIDFVYGGFDNLAYDFIKERIQEYETNEGGEQNEN